MARLSIQVKGGITLRNLQQIMYMIPGSANRYTVVNLRRKWYNPRVVELWIDVDDGETNEEDASIHPTRQDSV